MPTRLNNIRLKGTLFQLLICGGVNNLVLVRECQGLDSCRKVSGCKSLCTSSHEGFLISDDVTTEELYY